MSGKKFFQIDPENRPNQTTRSAIITIVDEAKVDPLLDALHRIDEETQQLGLRAFVWNIEKTI